MYMIIFTFRMQRLMTCLSGVPVTLTQWPFFFSPFDTSGFVKWPIFGRVKVTDFLVLSKWRIFCRSDVSHWQILEADTEFIWLFFYRSDGYPYIRHLRKKHFPRWNFKRGFGSNLKFKTWKMSSIHESYNLFEGSIMWPTKACNKFSDFRVSASASNWGSEI